jgi:hypothetical protein
MKSLRALAGVVMMSAALIYGGGVEARGFGGGFHGGGFGGFRGGWRGGWNRAGSNGGWNKQLAME